MYENDYGEDIMRKQPVIKEIAMHSLWEQRDVYEVCETKDYIVTNCLYRGVYVFDKNLDFLKCVFLDEKFIIHGFLVKFNENVITLWSYDDDGLWVIDLETDEKQKIDLLSSGYDFGTGLSECYFWSSESFVIIDRDANEYQINLATGKIKRLNYEELNVLLPEFCEYVDEAARYFRVKNYFPQELQFTYYDHGTSTIGFVDYKNKIAYSAPYSSDDVHEVYFTANQFIVTGCYAIVSVNKNGDQGKLTTPQYGQEFRGSILMAQKNEIVTFERYWRGSDDKMFLELLSIHYSIL